MKNHTEGPWHQMGNSVGVVSGEIATCYSNGGQFNTLANARLIAAAPELLAGLEGVIRVADRETDEFDAARAAIAKARGNS